MTHLSRALAAHAVLAASMAGWRAIEATPAASRAGGGFLASPIGQGCAALTVLVCVAALGLVAWSTVRGFELRLALLAALLLTSLAWRDAFDVFDLAYLLTTALLGVGHLALARRAASDPRADLPPDAHPA